MATEAAVLSTRDVSTGIARGEQPRACLTPEQIHHIEETWTKVEESGLLENGMQLFKHIFTLCPPAQKMFKKMQNVPFNELENDENFRSHSLQVMETIALAVSILDDIDGLVGILQDLGMSHGPQGLQDAHFDLVGQALVATLEDGLKEEFTKEVKEAYIAFYTLVSQAMKEGLQEFSTTDTEQEPRT